MTEFYNEHDCNCQHPKDPIKEIQMFVANYYTSLLTKLRNHINDTSAGHVTAEEKEYWNNKADKISVRDLEEMLVNLKNKVNNIEESVLSDLKQWIKNKKYVTEDDMTSYVTKQINKIVAGEVSLNGYAKESWVLEQIAKITSPGGTLDLSKYALKTDLEDLRSSLNNLSTKVTNIENKITNIENGGASKNYEITNVAVAGNTLTITQNNMGSKSVTLPSNGGSTTIEGLTESEVKQMLVKAKTLIITKNGESYRTYNPFNSPSDITIDIVSGGSSGGGSGEKETARYQAFFQNTDNYDEGPDVPETGKGPTDYDESDERSKWETDAKNPNKGQYTWMTFAYLSNGVYGSWTTPVRITGKDGEAGTDATDKEQIYKLTAETEVPSKPTSTNVDDFVPSGWTDNPQGVTQESPCEWTCVRTKNSDTNTWSDWSEPALWSHYGHNGTDGDGVEYIFWAGPNEQSYPSSEPNSWYTNEQSKNDGEDSNGEYTEGTESAPYSNTKYYNKREYIKKGSGWQDDPIDLSQSNYGPGSRQYVSTRKKRGDKGESSESSDSYWHEYSEPALWSYYAQDGDAGKGVTLNLDNNTMAVPLNSNETNMLFEQKCTARFYNGTSTVSIKNIECVIYGPDGNQISADEGLYISTSDNSIDNNCKDITIHAEQSKLDFTSGGYTIKVQATADITGEDTTRYATIQLVGVNFGEDGVSYRLGLSSSVVKVSRGARYPGEIDVTLIKCKGSETPTTMAVSKVIAIDNRWSFKYSIDGGSEQTLTDDKLYASLINSANNTIRVELDFENKLVDSETIVFVADGIQGQNGISYSVDVQADDVIGQYSGDNLTYSGTVKFYVTKLVSNESSDKLNDSIVTVKAYIGSVLSDEATVSYDSANKLWTATINDTNKAFLLINVSEKSSGMYYTSAVVPFITPGKDGSTSAPQTLKGSPLRMLGTWQKGKEYFDGTIAASDGVKYQDIVVYNNKYYVCVNHDEIANLPNKWNTQPTDTSYWQNMAVTEDFVVDKLAANQAYIKELSSEEVVIMDGDDVVAGMTSSKAIDSSSDLYQKVTNKGNVRIWAGRMEDNSTDLTTTPFNVTDTGVLTSGTDNKIILDNGTIYFVVDGTTWKLGITDGKPDWINDNGYATPVSYYVKKETSNSVSFSSSSLNNLYVKDNVYYTGTDMKNKANGTYYFNAGKTNCVYNINNYYVLVGNNVADCSFYRKVVISDGAIISSKIVGIGKQLSLQGDPSSTATGTANVGTYTYWLKFSKSAGTVGSWAKCTSLDSTKQIANVEIVDSNKVLFDINSSNQNTYTVMQANSETESEAYTTWYMGMSAESTNYTLQTYSA